MKELDIILETLLAEKPEYKDIAISSDRDGKRQLMQILLTVRQPEPVSEVFIRAQDTELKRQRDEKGIIQISDIPSCTTDKRLKLWQGDITRLESVAFCCISTGEFRFPNQQAAEIAIRTVTDYFHNHPETGIHTVIFNVFKDVDYFIYCTLLT